jgi:pimeloyl-ACP methyl ester carboxylesterase
MSSFLSPDIPTVMMQGASDFCDLPSGSEGQEKYFPKGYERILLEGVGHFPHREAPSAVADAWLRFSRISLPI